MRCLAVTSITDLEGFLQTEGLSPAVSNVLAGKSYSRAVVVEKLSPPFATTLLDKMEEARVKGFRLHRDAGENRETVSVILAGSPYEIMGLARTLGTGGAEKECEIVARELTTLATRILHPVPPPIQYQKKQLDFSGSPLLMGVLNITPDSFFDGGCYDTYEKAAERAFQLIDEGTDILDIGGASSRPGSEFVSDEEQMKRVLPVIQAVRKKWDGWISIDTYSSGVAKAALDQGADIINDISAGRIDPEMKEVAQTTGVPCILMHMKGTPKNMQTDPSYVSLMSEILEYFEERIQNWVAAGVSREQILVDPGIGFGKTLKHNLSLLKNLQEFEVLGRPVVLGTSRKSFIGAVLGRDVEDRLVGTLATLVAGAQNGAHVFRVHDVPESREALNMFHAIRRA